MVGGQLVTPVSQRQPPFWVWNKSLNQLHMSSYHIAPDLVGFYLNAMSRHRVTYLYGYTSSLYALAQAVIESGMQDIVMAVASQVLNLSTTINGQALLKRSNVLFVKPMECQKLLPRLASVLPGGCICGLRLGGWKLSKIVAYYLLVPQVIMSVRA